MARIPLGNFGNSIAQPGQSVRIPAGAFDEGGSGAQKLGDTAMHVSAQIMTEERSQEAALIRARAANAALDRESAIHAIGQQITQQIDEGKLHYNDAPDTYRKMVTGLGALDTTGMDPVTAENFSRSVKRAEIHGENSLDGVIKKARVADFKTQTEGLLDRIGKQSGLPGADVIALNASVDSEAVDTLGRQAYGGAWGKRKQDWKDNNWNDSLTQQAMQVRDDLKGITDLQKRITEGDYADKLDSNKRNALVGKLDAYRTSLIQRQEAAANRADRAAERHLKHAEAEFKTFQEIADKGTIIDPNYADIAMQKTAGTPYQAGIISMMQQAQENGGLASKPISAQQRTLDAIDKQIAATGRNPQIDKRRDQISKVLAGSERDLKENGLRAGLERGVITDLAPINISTPEAFAASVGQRMQQAEAVGQWAGKAVSPLDAKEAAAMKDMLDALPPKQRAGAVATLSGSVGPRAAAAIAAQIDEKDRPLALAFAHSGSQTTSDRYTSELIIKGATAIKDGTAMKDEKKVTGWKASIAKEVEGLFPNDKEAQAVKDSAYYIAAGIAHENGGNVSGSDLQRAVRLSVGGSIVERNGKRIPVPAGIDQDALDKRLRSVTGEELSKQAPDGKVRVAGVEMPIDDFAKSVPGQELIYAGPGRYAVVVKGRPVVNSANRPIIIGVK